MLTELKTINIINKAIFTLIVVRISLPKFVQNFYFNICVVHIEFFIFGKFSCNYPLVGILIVDALDNLAKCALIYDSNDLVAIGYLLPYFC